MKAQWLIESGLFEDTERKLIKSLEENGYVYRLLKYIPFDEDLVKRVEEMFEKESCVVFYGSLNLGRKLRKCSFVPGVYLDDKKYECTSYYPVLGDELLHSSYMMLPYGDIKRRKDELFELYGDVIFIRPNSGYKQFTGNILDRDNFNYGLDLAGFYDVEPDLLCVISNAKNIKKEWRFVIVNGKAISGSLYRDWTKGPDKIANGTTTQDLVLLGSKSVNEYCDDEDAFEYANKIAKMYNPESAWTLDVTLTKDGEYKVIEIGCFSCAGMYGNDINKIIDEVSKAALSDWKEYFE